MRIARHVVMIVIDGLRPDALLSGDTPALKKLIAGGTSTMKARTVMPSWTLPCHTSLFYGVAPESHGVTNNTFLASTRPLPSLVQVIRAATKRKTAMFYNWEELRDMAPPGSLDASMFIHYQSMDGDASDQTLFAGAGEWLAEHDFAFAFVYYGAADVAGHEHGWMSAEYMERVHAADRAVGRLLTKLPSHTNVIVLSDHGGHERTHGTDCDEDVTIPVILHGPELKAGRTLTSPVSILDIAPTITTWMGIPKPPEWEGSAIS